MKSLLCAIFSGALLCAIALAQDATPPPSPQQSPTTQAPPNEQVAKPSGSEPSSTGRADKTPAEATGVKRLAPGSVIPVQLTKSIDAKKAKTGDEVVAKVTQDMKSNTGEVVVAKDTRVIGHVTEVQPSSKEQKESQVGIAFDRAVTKDGGEMQMPMSIQAIIGPQSNSPNSGASPPPEESPAGRTAGTSSGQTPGMRGSATTSAPSPSSGYPTSEPQEGSGNARQPITAQTQGVVGMPNLKLESAGQTAAQGSVVTSEKNNVKLDSGTRLLLRVNQ